MSEMIERVARAVWEKRREMARLHHGVELEEWGDGTYPRANHVYEEAKTAIEAMREPTDAMCDAADWQQQSEVNQYQWAIDAALSK